MNKKEIREIKSRFRSDRSNVRNVYVCYVSSSGEIISSFCQPFSMSDADEQEKYLKIFQKSLGGSIGRQLHTLDFSTSQVAGSSEHGLLMKLRDSELKDEDALKSLHETIISAVHFDTNFAIVSAYDAYDVPYVRSDGTFDDGGENLFRYFVCAVCPVKLSKTELTYCPEEKEFHNKGTDSVLGAPEIAFLFPAFDDRASNLYSLLYYTKSLKDSSESFVDTLFHLKAPVPASIQKDNFSGSLSGALSDDCTADTVKAIQSLLVEKIQVAKEEHLSDTPTISRSEISEILNDRSIPDEKIADFNVRFDSSFGSDADVAAINLMNPKRIEIKTADAVIQLDSEHPELLEARRIGENRYLMIKVQDGDSITMNGVEISIS